MARSRRGGTGSQPEVASRAGPVTGYVPSLDGLRALAVTLVVGYHFYPRLVGLRVGVDLFFSISGFLITSILMTELATTDTIGLRRFYRRRMARLYPALALVVLVTAALYGIGRFEGWQETLAAVPASLTYTSSYWLVLGGNSLRLLAHTWSLSVEEVFYLLWPLALLAAHRRGWPVRRTITVATAIALGWHVVLAGFASDTWIYNMPDARAIQLLAGACVAVLVGRLGQSRRVLTWVGLGSAVLYAALVLDVVHERQPRLLLAALAGAGIVAWAFHHPRASLLASPAARWVGIRSYGIYLIHLPLLGLDNEAWPFAVRLGVRLAAVGFTVVLADVMYRKWERPLRDRLSAPSGVGEDLVARSDIAPTQRRTQRAEGSGGID